MDLFRFSRFLFSLGSHMTRCFAVFLQHKKTTLFIY